MSPWVAEVVGWREEALIAMDWTDFDADDQTTLALSLVTGPAARVMATS